MPTPSAATPTLLPLRGGDASIVDEGSGPPVVLVHGLPGSVRDFRWLTPHLVAAGLRAVRVDLPGFGGTPTGAGPDPSPEGRAAFVLDVIEALALPPVTLVGHSMGGLVATAAAEQRPHLLRGLALISSPGLRPHRPLRRFPARTLHAAVGHPARRRVFMPAVRRLFAAVGFERYPDDALVRTVAAVRATDLSAHAARVRRIRLPCFAAWCDDDPLVEADILRELAAALPPGPRVAWPDGGHNPQKTHAEALARALAAWIGAG